MPTVLEKLEHWKRCAGVDLTGYWLIENVNVHDRDYRVGLPFLGKNYLFAHVGEEVYYMEITHGYNSYHYTHASITKEEENYYFVLHETKVKLCKLTVEDFEEKLNPIPLERRLARLRQLQSKSTLT